MTALKVLGIEKITPKIVITAIVTLTWFGVATNGLFDLWKLTPTLFEAGYTYLDWKNIMVDLLPFLTFCGWVSLIYFRYNSSLNKRALQMKTSRSINPHKGLIFALSTPKRRPEDIIEFIKNTEESAIEVLFHEWSIGQLFKGLFHHKKELIYVWPLTTKESEPYSKCIDEFLTKFIPAAKIYGDKETTVLCDLSVACDDRDIIEKTKTALAGIYSKENLSDMGIERSDIIVDISGGHKPITIGLVFGALDSAIDIQYVEQKTYNVIPLFITPEMILDKTGEYLLELYAKLYEVRQKESAR